MAQAILNSTDGEWTTVTAKKGYVPPHLRTKEAAAAKPLSLADEDDFPTLGGKSNPKPLAVSKPPTISNAANPFTIGDFPTLGAASVNFSGSSKVSFTQKIKDLICSEQQNEADRAAAEERKKELEGFVALPLKFTPERYFLWNEKMSAALSKEKDYEDITQFAVGYVPSTPYPTPMFPNFPKDNCDDTFSDLDDMSEPDYDYIEAVY